MEWTIRTAIFSTLIGPTSGIPIRPWRTLCPSMRWRRPGGVRIRLTDGRDLIDGMASWWCAIHGYNHPRLNAAAKNQMEHMSHVMFGGLTHAPAVELSRLLVELTPPGLETVFLCDSGSVSVEVAMKMALQYWQARGMTRKKRFATIRNGYHGDTFGAMSVCDPDTGMHSLFSGVLPQNYFADAPRIPFHHPWDESDIQSLEQILQRHASTTAAIILEPVVQGAGGMRFYHPRYVAPGSGNWLTNTRCCSSPTRLPPDSVAPESSSPASMPASVPTSCVWASP